MSKVYRRRYHCAGTRRVATGARTGHQTSWIVSESVVVPRRAWAICCHFLRRAPLPPTFLRACLILRMLLARLLTACLPPTFLGVRLFALLAPSEYFFRRFLLATFFCVAGSTRNACRPKRKKRMCQLHKVFSEIRVAVASDSTDSPQIRRMTKSRFASAERAVICWPLLFRGLLRGLVAI